jgi:hypothetical protein
MSRPYFIDLETVPLGTTLERPNGVPDWWLERLPFVEPQLGHVDRSNYRGDRAQVRRLALKLQHEHALKHERAAWMAERLNHWRRRALDPYTAEIVSVAAHPVQGDVPGPFHGVCDNEIEMVREHGETEAELVRRLEDALAAAGVSHLVHWGAYDTPVLREAMCRAGGHFPTLRSITRQRVRELGPVYPACLDARPLTNGARFDRERRWSLKSVAAAVGIQDTARVASASIYDAWLERDCYGVAERAAVDVSLMMQILQRERALMDVIEWATGDRW